MTIIMSKIEAQMKAQAQISHVDHNAALNIDSTTIYSRLTGIICTIGPASREIHTLLSMIKAGMTIARLHFTEESYDYHIQTIKNIREAVEMMKEEECIKSFSLAIALDVTGPEVRTGLLKGGDSPEVNLIKGNLINITISERYFNKCSDKTLFVDYKNLPQIIKIGERIFLDDGHISLIVKDITGDFVECEVEHGGILKSRSKCNFPGTVLTLPAITPKDKEDLKFAMEHKLDIIFASFIRNAQNIKEIRKFLGDRGKRLLIVAKVENHEGIQKIDEILDECDGVLIARGDMGLEIPIEQIFLVQKMMTAKCNIRGKPVICSTDMLKSMTYNPRPTGAESSDVANAVLDGADCLMLVSETSYGSYPLRSIKVMSAICKEAEAAFSNKSFFIELLSKLHAPTNRTVTISICAVLTAMKCFASLIIVLTTSGETAHQISKYRPRCPVVMVTRTEIIARQALLWRGITPIHYESSKSLHWYENIETRIKFAIEFSKKRKLLHDGDTVVVVSGWKQGCGISNTLQIMTI